MLQVYVFLRFFYKKKYAASFFHQKIKITPLCCEVIFFKKVDKTLFEISEIGHFKNVQKKKFENTFATIFKKNAKNPSFYYPFLCNLVIFLRNSSI